MAVKAKPKARPKKAVKKAVKKAAPAKKKPALTCSVCGFRVVVDEDCGCVEEHVLLCCDQPMLKS